MKEPSGFELTYAPAQRTSDDLLSEDFSRIAQRSLDEGFFQVRYEGRATDAERKFLHAMAQCAGPPYSMAEITRALGKASQRALSVRRSGLIKKGLIYAPEHGAVDYTVPHFAHYLRRRES